MRLILMIRCCAAGAAIAALPRPSAGQSDTVAIAQPGFCWRARPLPRCKTFPITEFSALAALATSRTELTAQGTGSHPDIKSRMAWSIGVMRNDSPRRAQGIVVTLGMDGYLAPAIEWRNRVWLAPSRSAADFGAGYAQKTVYVRNSGEPVGDYHIARGVTASTALSPVDLIGIIARADLLFTPGRSHYGLFVGAQTGSYGSVIVTTAMAAFLLIVIASIGGGDY